jgi:hypothetical protein
METRTVYTGIVTGRHMGTQPSTGAKLFIVNARLDDLREVTAFYTPGASLPALNLTKTVNGIVEDALTNAEGRIEMVLIDGRTMKDAQNRTVPAPAKWSVHIPAKLALPEEVASEFAALEAGLKKAADEAAKADKATGTGKVPPAKPADAKAA